MTHRRVFVRALPFASLALALASGCATPAAPGAAAPGTAAAAAPRPRPLRGLRDAACPDGGERRVRLERAADQRLAGRRRAEAVGQRAAQQHHLRRRQVHPLDHVVHGAGERQRPRQGRPVLHRGDEQGGQPLGRAGPPPRDGDPEGARLFAVVHGALDQASAGQGEGRDVRTALQGVLGRHRRSHDPPADVHRHVPHGGGRRRDRRARLPLRRRQRRRDRRPLHRLLRRRAPRRSEVREGEEDHRGADPERPRQPDRLPARAAEARDGQERVEDAAQMGAAQARRRRGRLGRDQADRQGSRLGRRRPHRGLLDVQDAREGLHAEGRRRREPPVRHRGEPLQEAQVRRAGLLLSEPQRHRDRDALRGRQAVDPSGRPRQRRAEHRRQGRPLPGQARAATTSST